MNEPPPTKRMKNLVLDGVIVGQFEASVDYQVELERTEALLKSLGKWKPPSKEMAMFNHAAAFAHATGEIYKTFLGDPSQYARGAAPFVVNSTFAIEVYLKTLHRMHGKILKGHKLLDLFGALSSEIKLKIENDYLKFAAAQHIESPISLHKLMASLNESFVQWRYTYEFSTTELIHIQETIVFMESLHKLGSSMLTQGKY